MYCWGLGTSGQLGNGTTTSSSTPVAVTLTGITGMNSITAGYNFACGQTSTSSGSPAGTAYCWGDNGDGQLGNGTTTSSSTPVKVKNSSGVLSGKLVAAVTAGYYHACALDTSGVPYCWGYDAYGQLGNNNSTTSPSAPIPR